MEKNITDLVHQIHNNLKSYLLPDLTRVELSFYALETLRALVEHETEKDDKNWTISHLADYVGITQPGMSTLIRSLEEKNLIVVRPSEKDRRQRVITASELGKQICQNVTGEAQESYNAFFNGIPENEIQTAFEVLSRLNVNLSRKIRKTRPTSRPVAYAQ